MIKVKVVHSLLFFCFFFSLNRYSNGGKLPVKDTEASGTSPHELTHAGATSDSDEDVSHVESPKLFSDIVKIFESKNNNSSTSATVANTKNDLTQEATQHNPELDSRIKNLIAPSVIRNVGPLVKEQIASLAQNIHRSPIKTVPLLDIIADCNEFKKTHVLGENNEQDTNEKLHRINEYNKPTTQNIHIDNNKQKQISSSKDISVNVGNVKDNNNTNNLSDRPKSMFVSRREVNLVKPDNATQKRNYRRIISLHAADYNDQNIDSFNQNEKTLVKPHASELMTAFEQESGISTTRNNAVPGNVYQRFSEQDSATKIDDTIEIDNKKNIDYTNLNPQAVDYNYQKIKINLKPPERPHVSAIVKQLNKDNSISSTSTLASATQKNVLTSNAAKRKHDEQVINNNAETLQQTFDVKKRNINHKNRELMHSSLYPVQHKRSNDKSATDATYTDNYNPSIAPDTETSSTPITQQAQYLKLESGVLNVQQTQNSSIDNRPNDLSDNLDVLIPTTYNYTPKSSYTARNYYTTQTPYAVDNIYEDLDSLKPPELPNNSPYTVSDENTNDKVNANQNKEETNINDELKLPAPPLPPPNLVIDKNTNKNEKQTDDKVGANKSENETNLKNKPSLQNLFPPPPSFVSDKNTNNDKKQTDDKASANTNKERTNLSNKSSLQSLSPTDKNTNNDKKQTDDEAGANKNKKSTNLSNESSLKRLVPPLVSDKNTINDKKETDDEASANKYKKETNLRNTPSLQTSFPPPSKLVTSENTNTLQQTNDKFDANENEEISILRIKPKSQAPLAQPSKLVTSENTNTLQQTNDEFNADENEKLSILRNKTKLQAPFSQPSNLVTNENTNTSQQTYEEFNANQNKESTFSSKKLRSKTPLSHYDDDDNDKYDVDNVNSNSASYDREKLNRKVVVRSNQSTGGELNKNVISQSTISRKFTKHKSLKLKVPDDQLLANTEVIQEILKNPDETSKKRKIILSKLFNVVIPNINFVTDAAVIYSLEAFPNETLKIPLTPFLEAFYEKAGNKFHSFLRSNKNPESFKNRPNTRISSGFKTNTKFIFYHLSSDSEELTENIIKFVFYAHHLKLRHMCFFLEDMQQMQNFDSTQIENFFSSVGAALFTLGKSTTIKRIHYASYNSDLTYTKATFMKEHDNFDLLYALSPFNLDKLEKLKILTKLEIERYLFNTSIFSYFYFKLMDVAYSFYFAVKNLLGL